MSVLGLVLALAVAGVFWRAGQEEIGSGVPWGGLSLVVSAVVLLWFQAGLITLGLAQVGLLLGIGVVRALLERDRG